MVTHTLGPKRNLAGEATDFLMIGGLSGIFLILFVFFSPDGHKAPEFARAILILHTLVNFPHFIISYQFLYGDNRKKILTHWRFTLAGLIIPFLLLGHIGLALTYGNAIHVGYLANAMLLLVGWHYTRQIVGAIVVTAHLKGYPLDSSLRRMLSIHAVSIWGLSYLNGNMAEGLYQFFGIEYKTFSFPPNVSLVFWALGLSSLLGILSGVRNTYIHKALHPPLSTMAAFSTFYIWHLPLFYHPGFALLIPFFHSLQYILFASVYVKNRIKSSLTTLRGVAARESFLRRMTISVGVTIVAGRVFFNIFPEWLDATVPYDREKYGTELFLFLFYVFINIHHYFIDFAIWRRDNKNVRDYVFS